MASVKYVGDRAYVEFQHEGLSFGFARGMTRDDIPEELATRFNSSGFPQWEVNDLDGEELLAVVEHDDSANEEADFNANWTRQEMIKWFSARGESTPRTATKASLITRAEALLNPTPPVVEETAEEDESNAEEPEPAVEEQAEDGGEGDK